MDKMNNTDQADEAAPVPGAPRAMSRRRFASSGMVGAGALLTIASAPAMATAPTCATPSGTLSGDLLNSHNANAKVVCGGQSPEYYCANQSKWSSLHNKKFGAANVFDCRGTNAASYSRPYTYSNATMLQLIKGECKFNDQDGLGKYFATAYLNIALKKIDFLTLAQLQILWNELQNNGGYKPSGGTAIWRRADVIKYLKRTYK